MARRWLASELKADFAIQGGGHVFDAMAVPDARATQLFDQYRKREQDCG
jgi:Icc protein